MSKYLAVVVPEKRVHEIVCQFTLVPLIRSCMHHNRFPASSRGSRFDVSVKLVSATKLPRVSFLIDVPSSLTLKMLFGNGSMWVKMENN